MEYERIVIGGEETHDKCKPFFALDLTEGIPVWVRAACKKGSILTPPLLGTYSQVYFRKDREIGILWDPPSSPPIIKKEQRRRDLIKKVSPTPSVDEVRSKIEVPGRIAFMLDDKRAKSEEDKRDLELFYDSMDDNREEILHQALKGWNLSPERGYCKMTWKSWSERRILFVTNRNNLYI